MIILSGSETKLGQLLLPELRNSYQVFAFDKDNGRIEDCQFIERIINEIKPEYFINLQEISNYIDCEYYPENCYNINAKAVKNIANLCLQNNTKLFQLSTVFVYGNSGSKEMTEKDELKPSFYYSDSKYLAEKYISEVQCENTILRCGERYELPGTFLNNIINEILNNKDVNIPHEMEISAVSERTISNFIINAIENKISGTYNIANSGQFRLFEIIERLLNITNKNSKMNKISYEEFLYPVDIPEKCIVSTIKSTKNKSFSNIDIMSEIESYTDYLQKNI